MLQKLSKLSHGKKKADLITAIVIMIQSSYFTYIYFGELDIKKTL